MYLQVPPERAQREPEKDNLQRISHSFRPPDLASRQPHLNVESLPFLLIIVMASPTKGDSWREKGNALFKQSKFGLNLSLRINKRIDSRRQHNAIQKQSNYSRVSSPPCYSSEGKTYCMTFVQRSSSPGLRTNHFLHKQGIVQFKAS